ncbi:isoleucine--tRNA ligase, cytoplasmic-like isoform X4 [Pogoniulus pusillus]|uniref:isoleucine--tRNA ligase, cytoplasmic-like isoform X4 n=1 Tax=Pogoniulus pusillus TaxID=488313 RepID=UPI0030B972BC
MAASTERQAGGQGVSGQREASRVPRQSCVLCLSQQRSLGSSMPQDWDSGLILKVTIKLSPEFMESVWWVFKQLYDKGLVYRGVKVMPFSTACNTPLSHFESHQNYKWLASYFYLPGQLGASENKDAQDPSVTVSFPLDEEASVSLVAGTTTPWTLPSNLALVLMQSCNM